MRRARLHRDRETTQRIYAAGGKHLGTILAQLDLPSTDEGNDASSRSWRTRAATTML
jgi:hypothetical protein